MKATALNNPASSCPAPTEKVSTFSELLRAASKEKHLSVSALAHAVETSVSQIERVFAGERTDIGVVRKVVEVLEVTFEQVRTLENIGDAVVYLWCPEVGEHLRNTRGAIATSAMATKIGVSTSTINRWENGTVRPNETNIAALVAAYGVELVDLIGNGLWPPVRYPGASRIGTVLAACRLERNITQRGFARALGFNIRTYRAWEMGCSQPGPKARQQLADALDIDVALLDECYSRVERHHTNRSEFATMLVTHRKTLGMSREELARRNGLSITEIQGFEILDHTPQFRMLGRIAKVYQLNAEQVLNFLPSSPDDSFGSWMKKCRQKAVKSNQDMQDETGISRNSFVFFESNRVRPNSKTMTAIARALNIPLYEAQARLAAAGPVVVTPFALACRNAREAAGLTRGEANRAFGIGSSITQMEQSCWVPSLAKLPVLAAILQVPVEVLDKAWRETKLVPA
jgi:transcriptional regulator with XRE-family HTH domain